MPLVFIEIIYQSADHVIDFYGSGEEAIEHLLLNVLLIDGIINRKKESMGCRRPRGAAGTKS
jgi:hypothetical protein